MNIEAIKELIRPELILLSPVLFLLGKGLKKSQIIKDKYIPLILGAAGAVLSCLWCAGCAPVAQDGVAGLIFASVTQGILAAGESVYMDQIIKQAKKEE